MKPPESPYSLKSVETLYNASDVKRVREYLHIRQNGLCALTGLPLASKDAVLDHCHETQAVRGVIDRQVNLVIGKIENSYNRYMKYWYKGTINDFLSKASYYLSTPKTTGYIHPGWLKRVRIDFNKLKVKDKDIILEVLTGVGKYTNDTERKAVFNKVLLTKQYDYSTILQLLQEKELA